MNKAITLQELLGFTTSLDHIEVTSLTDDSRKVQPGALFLAYQGSCGDGKAYLEDAIKRGAVAVLLDAPVAKALTVPSLVIPDLKNLVATLADRFYHHPLNSLALYGVTGTNGKTSTTYYLAQLLEGLGVASAVVGTTGYGVLGKLETSINTTPGAVTLRAMLAQLRDANIKSVALEVSSHSLVQERTLGLKFNAVIFTNLTQDHLDYHHTMENYAKAKFKLFYDYAAKHLVVNADDAWGQQLIEAFKDDARLITFSAKGNKADLVATNVGVETGSIQATLQFHQKKAQLTLPLIGMFNLANVLAAFAALLAEGYPLQVLSKLAAKLSAVTGRMQVVKNGHVKAKLVVVDYAHTPDALTKALLSLKPYVKAEGKLYVVFGCGGDRDHTKRPIMGSIAAKYADRVVITSDNPRSESPNHIIEDILSGVTDVQRTKVTVEPNRSAAIHLALAEAKELDIVLVAGKGHETYQIIGDQTLPFSDQQEISNFI